MFLKRLARVALATVVGGYLLICGGLYALQRRLVFPRPSPHELSERLAKVVQIPGPHPTVAWYREAPAGAPTVIHFHGNGTQLSGLDWFGQRCKQRGLGWFAVEYPGYGIAPGEISETSELAAAESAAQWLEKSGVGKRDMVLLGQSLGTGPAVYLASKGYGRAMVLITPYTAISDIGARNFPWLPVRLLMRDPIKALEWAPRVKIPTLAFHSTDDRVIPFQIGKGLVDAIPGAKLVVMNGVGHNGIWDPPGTTERILDFLAAP